MRKFLLILICVLLNASAGWAGQITALPVDTEDYTGITMDNSPAPGDYVYGVGDPSGSPSDEMYPVRALGVPQFITISTNTTLTAEQCTNAVIYVTAACTVTLSAVHDKGFLTVITVGDVAVSVDTNAADKIWRDGTAQDDGDKITNLSTAGNLAVISYYSADGWMAVTDGWTDGGA